MDLFYIDPAQAEAKIYRHFGNNRHTTTYLAKVSFPDIGLFINGITAQPSPKHPERGLWIQLPRYSAKGKWYRPFEASKASPLFQLIEKLVNDAVAEYMADLDISVTLDDFP